jgi:hypothetical protein
MHSAMRGGVMPEKQSRNVQQAAPWTPRGHNTNCPLIGQNKLSCDWSDWTLLWLVRINCLVIGQNNLTCDWSESAIWLVRMNSPVIGQYNLYCDGSVLLVLLYALNTPSYNTLTSMDVLNLTQYETYLKLNSYHN